MFQACSRARSAAKAPQRASGARRTRGRTNLQAAACCKSSPIDRATLNTESSAHKKSASSKRKRSRLTAKRKTRARRTEVASRTHLVLSNSYAPASGAPCLQTSKRGKVRSRALLVRCTPQRVSERSRHCVQLVLVPVRTLLSTSRSRNRRRVARQH